MDQPKGNSENSSSQVVNEFVVRTPKDKQKRFHIMRFKSSQHVDVTKWKQVKMERENNLKEFKLDDDNPKYGAGSEFGRDQKEESRRKKHGIVVKQYNPDDQPWILKLGKGNKKFKGIREGGVTENASYYVFTQASDGTFEAYPVAEWYNFANFQCFNALSAEEAEEEYGRRDKIMNFFSIMIKKRLQTDTKEEEEEDEKKQGNRKKKKEQKDFKISDMDEWANLTDSGGSESDEEGGDKPSKKKPPKKESKKKGKKKKENEEKSDDEAIEESDEGDFDDKEVDYITSSSESEEEIEEDEKANRDLKGVEDEDALRKLMEDEDEEEEEAPVEAEGAAEAKEKPAEQKPKQKPKKSDTSGESSSESSDSDFDDPKYSSALFAQNVQKSKKKNGSDNSAGSSRANTPTRLQGEKEGQKGQKRKYPELPAPNVKKAKMENQVSHSSANTLDAINEETVRRYLQRKPMTASELLHKFRSKKTKMSSDQLVNKIADVLKRMALQKTNIKGKMYLSLKPQ